MAEVRESIELVHTAEYGAFLRVFFPPFLQLLRDLPPSFADNADHKLRNMLLEILNRRASLRLSCSSQTVHGRAHHACIHQPSSCEASACRQEA